MHFYPSLDKQYMPFFEELIGLVLMLSYVIYNPGKTL